MPIVSSDIKLYHAAVEDDSASNGGTITANEITDNVVNNLFPNFSADEAVSGKTRYRKYFVKNTHATLTYYAVKAWIDTFTPSTDTDIFVALGTPTDTQADADDYTYYQPNAKTHPDALNPGDIIAGDSFSIWIKIVLQSGASAYTEDYGRMKHEGETAA